MATTTSAPKTADQLRAEATACVASVQESWERSDTDGFLSQWAGTITATLKRRQADITEAGGVATFPALFDLDGELVAAKLIYGQYGWVWGLLPSDDPRGQFTGWFNPSRATKAATRRANDARKGYQVGLVSAPAWADTEGGGTGLGGCASVYVATYRTDGGFSRAVEVLSTSDYQTDY